MKEWIGSRRRFLGLAGTVLTGPTLTACSFDGDKQQPTPTQEPIVMSTEVISDRDIMLPQVSPEKNELFLIRQQDAKRFIEEWLNPERLKGTRLSPYDESALSDFSSWRITEPTHSARGPLSRDVVVFSGGYDVNTDELSYFKMYGDIGNEIYFESLEMMVPPQHIGWSPELLSLSEKVIVTKEALHRLLLLPDDLNWREDAHSVSSENEITLIPKVSTRYSHDEKQATLNASFDGNVNLTVTGYKRV